MSKHKDKIDYGLGSHDLSPKTLQGLDNAGIYSAVEFSESMWEVLDSDIKTKQDVIDSMELSGFVYSDKLFEV